MYLLLVVIHISGDFVQDENITFSGEHVREGLTCVVSVIVPNPEFEGQTQVCKTIVILILFFGNYICSSNSDFLFD